MEEQMGRRFYLLSKARKFNALVSLVWVCWRWACTHIYHFLWLTTL